ncbi:MAG: (Fe-S)-binding protein [Burkholderiaceae bacterium]|nr:(Fe-S)-binding protein [Burkholderiaceae bacterium]
MVPPELNMPTTPATEAPPHPRVALFVTCLVDAMRPRVGFAALQLLREAGCRVEVPPAQTCCGQPAFNSGDTKDAAAVARHFVRTFEGFDYVVAPSGSCVGWEITSFLVDVMRHRPQGRRLDASATYHDSCSGLRELGVHDQPRALLGAVAGLELKPLEGHDVCCGFGGTFCVKYPAISNAVVGDKAAAVERSGAQLLLGGDLGCLMNMAGKLARQGSKVRSFHTVEVLAGMADGPAIGEPG